MCSLLRHPARVPALFSGAVEPEPRRPRGPRSWRRVAAGRPHPANALAAVILVELPLVKAGMAVLGFALHG